MRQLATLIFLVLTVTVVAKVSAVYELDVSGNASGSDNSIVVQSGSSINVQQGGSIELTNEIDARANTGGNSASGNEGETTITTGDATTEVEVNNFFNQNKAIIGCCTPTPIPTQKPQSAPDPTATPVPAVGGAQPTTAPAASTGASTSGSSSGSGGGTGGSSAAGGQVLGLSATSGPVSVLEYAFYLAASICLSGAKLLRVSRA
ncbi:hypothetical protein A3C34_01555 [Candidatus Amesbacteria bacterium RIFCSPHIGHO2_02_FULL_48_21]|uniref:Uncharacterized protein n=4 Tax=Candidatus Amesiibacteriota TaxID=1752730 RepID=A0A1F4Z5P7_9BACT|nr:MAG: hypothetical protein UX78_C0020G0002 [Candidatus Amesbacteria bacterium GW2011_GWA2_47_11]KKU94806.1 MAG: hypothetical protein UY22_C0006G0004 [Candidatus Amesbacteria bacterium GW2011_GWC1_48_10]KKW00773.1 MAG: hypothetical protein UY33_C0005G0002 [Candidatus Amesbacteria bacterium GW2011_GWA1_48_9]OGC95633.1 MAG: hypothetical protein A3C34_01555 [Candidatus Amesbacteria bacterium RIFCSPHIGHO2_02_FULL_48_21]OGD01642.1 MAG: hypothetical protein A3E17_03715 [Candidatus Amesbacteria bacte